MASDDECVILIVRHPDYADMTWTEGPIREIYFDLGGSYDITNVGPHDHEALDEDIATAKRLLGEFPYGEIHNGLVHLLEILEGD